MDPARAVPRLKVLLLPEVEKSLVPVFRENLGVPMSY